jgi:hypothetical protein
MSIFQSNFNLGEHEDHGAKDVAYIIFLATVFMFVLVGSYMESKHLSFGHETGFIIPFGMLISWIAYAKSEEHEKTF